MSASQVKDPRTSPAWGPPEFVPQVEPGLADLTFSELPEGAGPAFSVSETAKIFFARSPHWLRWLEREGHLTDADGVSLVQREGGIRTYGLKEVEAISHAMASKGRITGVQLLMTMRVLRSIAGVWGLLAPDGKSLRKDEIHD